jgi:hypothetical protein
VRRNADTIPFVLDDAKIGEFEHALGCRLIPTPSGRN